MIWENDIDAIFRSRHQFLWDLNMQFIQLIISCFPREWKLKYTHTYEVEPGLKVIDLRKGVPAGETSLSLKALPVYDQIHRFSISHLPNLSILDVLCHLGPGTMDYLSRYAHELYK